MLPWGRMRVTGCGASASRLVGCKPRRIVDLHNTGCVSFLFMLELARDLMASGAVKTALLCCVQNAAGRVFAHEGNRCRPQSAVPGDGCGVGYAVADDSAPVRSVVTHAYGDFADDMRVTSDDHRAWWEPHQGPFYVDFTEERIAKIIARGNRLVPEVVLEACRAADLTPAALDLLVTAGASHAGGLLRDLGGRDDEPRGGARRVVRRVGAGPGDRRPAADRPRRSRRLSGLVGDRARALGGRDVPRHDQARRPPRRSAPLLGPATRGGDRGDGGSSGPGGAALAARPLRARGAAAAGGVCVEPRRPAAGARRAGGRGALRVARSSTSRGRPGSRSLP